MRKSIFTIYYKTGCPFCEEAKDIITNQLKITPLEIEVTNRPHLREELIQETQIKTVPIIFLGNQLIGGCSDLKKLMEEDIVDFKFRIIQENLNIINEHLYGNL